MKKTGQREIWMGKFGGSDAMLCYAMFCYFLGASRSEVFVGYEWIQ